MRETILFCLVFLSHFLSGASVALGQTQNLVRPRGNTSFDALAIALRPVYAGSRPFFNAHPLDASRQSGYEFVLRL